MCQKSIGMTRFILIIIKEKWWNGWFIYIIINTKKKKSGKSSRFQVNVNDYVWAPPKNISVHELPKCKIGCTYLPISHNRSIIKIYDFGNSSKKSTAFMSKAGTHEKFPILSLNNTKKKKKNRSIEERENFNVLDCNL